MEYINKLFDFISLNKWYTLTGLIGFNIGAHIFKLITYKSLTVYISSVSELMFVNNILVNFFVKLCMIHLIQNIVTYFIEKAIIIRINEIFYKVVKRILYNKMDFFKKDTQNKINQIWFYLNGIENMIEKMLIDFPKIVTFLLYYIITIYNFSLLAVFLIVPVNIAIMYFLHPISQKQQKLQLKRYEQDLDVKNKLLEATANIELIKLNGKEPFELSRISTTFKNYTNNKIQDKWYSFIIKFISEMFDDLMVLIIYSIGISYVLNNELKAIDLLYLAVHTGNFYYYVMQLKEIYNYYQRITPRLDVIYDMLSDKYIEKLYKNKNQLCISDDDKTNMEVTTDYCVEFNNVSFTYNKKKNVLNNLSFKFKKNKINLLLGPNGSGKSTIIQLLLRLYEHPSLYDKIKLNGINIYDMNINDLRKQITFVSHEPYLFNETVWYNIKYGNEQKTDNEIMEICKSFNLSEWITENKHKIIGYKGKELSGGEKKKIQLLNSLCRNTDIIIFDEPTNTLDTSAIIWFIDFIKTLKHKMDKTVIIITHDLRLVDVSDNIVDLK